MKQTRVFGRLCRISQRNLSRLQQLDKRGQLIEARLFQQLAAQGGVVVRDEQTTAAQVVEHMPKRHTIAIDENGVVLLAAHQRVAARQQGRQKGLLLAQRARRCVVCNAAHI
jgi:hypothetical protein